MKLTYIYPFTETLVTGPITGPFSNGDVVELPEESVEAALESGRWREATKEEVAAHEKRESAKAKLQQEAAEKSQPPPEVAKAVKEKAEVAIRKIKAKESGTEES